jgi:hypothetical protein
MHTVIYGAGIRLWPALRIWIDCDICRDGQNHIYTVRLRYFWQGNHQIYGHIRCIYTVLANFKYLHIVSARLVCFEGSVVRCVKTVTVPLCVPERIRQVKGLP